MAGLSSIHARCTALLRAFESKGRDFGLELLPGLDPGALAHEIAWFPATIPRSMVELYSWRNGQPRDAFESECVFWFRDMQFMSVARAHAEYASMMSTYGVDNSRDRDGIDLQFCFPFASFNGGWYVVPCDGHDFDEARHPFPVLGVFQGIDLYFHSLESMLDTCAAWVVASEPEGQHYRLSDDEERAIWQRYNPGVFGHAP